MDAEFVEFMKGLTRRYEPFVFRYRHKSGLNHALKRINTILEHDTSLNVHTLKTCAVGRWKSMGLDVLTISKLAHHRSIETTRKHYDFFDTQKIICQMDGAVEGGRAHLFPSSSGKITALSLHSAPDNPSPESGQQKSPNAISNRAFLCTHQDSNLEPTD
jgi:hypothetical protein